MKFDKYTLFARIMPAMITLIPFVIFVYWGGYEKPEELFGIINFSVAGEVTIGIGLVFLLVYINRFLGKSVLESKVFGKGLDFPTTRFMLYKDDTFSEDYKDHLRDKFKVDFNITFPGKTEEANADETELRKEITELNGLIRQRVAGGHLLLKFNIEFGFFVNLLGGAIIASLVALFDFIYFFSYNDQSKGWICVVIFTSYIILMSLYKKFLNFYGNLYAKRLFLEYLGGV